MQILKYLKLILSFRQVSEVYREDNGKDKPFTLTRRFWGILFFFFGGVIATTLGVIIAPERIESAAGDISKIWDAVNIIIIPAITSLYGLVMWVIGEVKKK